MITWFSYTSVIKKHEKIFEKKIFFFYLTNCSSIIDESHNGLICERRISQRPFKHLSRNTSDVKLVFPPISASLAFFPFYYKIKQNSFEKIEFF